MINFTDKDDGMAVLEDLTSNVKQIQDEVLKEILTCDANTEYLRSFLHGSSDQELFKKNVPVGNYEDIKPYIERVVNGEPSNVISGKPIIGFILSSGTSSGKQKLIPLNNKSLENTRFISRLRYAVLSRHVDGHKQGKGSLNFIFTRPTSITPSGLPSSNITTFIFKTEYFRANNPFTSPIEVIYCHDYKQSQYCHLLCGLVKKDEVNRVGAVFASVLVQGIIFLESFWKEMCDNIRSGQLSDWITDLSCRDSVSVILGGPNPQLADLIEDICNQKSWKGIIPQLWPKTIYIEAIVTGQMAQYVSTLEYYIDNLPIVSALYSSSETTYGINLDPLCKPEDVSYTFMPNMAYFEFLPINGKGKDEGNDTIVDLANVKLGVYYEVVVTTYSGLHRCRVDDILQVTGFYNSAPQFKFVRRKHVVISLLAEATTEETLLKAVTCGAQVLKSYDMMLRDFTCYPHYFEIPGHYVLYWEFKGNNKDDINELINTNVLAECCAVVEESLGALYRKLRSQIGLIGALEIRLVEQGTFDCLMEYFIGQGASTTQYKTPRCIKSSEALQVLENKVLARFFSERSPPIDYSP